MLVWDPDLIAPMSLIADASFIRKNGVIKMVKLPLSKLTESYPDALEYIFLVRPSLPVVDQVIESIRWAVNPPLITGAYPPIPATGRQRIRARRDLLWPSLHTQRCTAYRN